MPQVKMALGMKLSQPSASMESKNVKSQKSTKQESKEEQKKSQSYKIREEYEDQNSLAKTIVNKEASKDFNKALVDPVDAERIEPQDQMQQDQMQQQHVENLKRERSSSRSRSHSRKS